MRSSLRPVAIVLAVGACAAPAASRSGTSSSTPTTPASASAPTPSSGAANVAPVAAPPASVTTSRPVLDIAAATLAWDGEHGAIMALDASGYLSISHDATAFLAVPIAKLTEGGELSRIDGTPVATIDDAGTVLNEGVDRGFVVRRDGTFWQRGEKLHFEIADDGAVWGTDPKTGGRSIRPDMRYVGPSAARRAIVLAKLAWSIWLPAEELAPITPGKAKTSSIPACDSYRTQANRALSCVTRDETWTKRIRIAIARVDGYAAELPRWGRDATASACGIGASRLKAYFATRSCAL